MFARFYARVLVAAFRLAAFLLALALGLHAIKTAGLAGGQAGAAIFDALSARYLLADTWRDAIVALGGLAGLAAGASIVGWLWWKLATWMRRPRADATR